MKQFLKDEFIRLVDKLPETDPTKTEYHVLLHSIEALEAIGSTIEDILTLAEENLEDPELPPIIPIPVKPIDLDPDPANPVPVPDPIEPPQEPAKTYTNAEVRAALVAAKKKGVDIKSLLAGFGGEKIQEVPEEKYAALMAALEVM